MYGLFTGYTEQFLSGVIAGQEDEVMSKVQRYHVTDNDLATLEGDAWLNDKVCILIRTKTLNEPPSSPTLDRLFGLQSALATCRWWREYTLY